MSPHLVTDQTPGQRLPYTFADVAAMARRDGCVLIDLGDEYVLRKFDQGTFHDLMSAECLQWLGHQMDLPISLR